MNLGAQFGVVKHQADPYTSSKLRIILDTSTGKYRHPKL